MPAATSDPKARVGQLLQRLATHQKSNKLTRRYFLNPNQENDGGPYLWAKEFHNAGANHKERLLMAANRVGKTECACAEDAIHLTGMYPPWWEGRRFDHPINMWCGAHTSDNLRDIVQEKLFGGMTQDVWGTGWIPKHLIHPDGPKMMKGVNDCIDFVRIKHASGGWSKLGFKTYKQGWLTWQGTAQHVVHFDEEPPEDVYAEGMTRTLDTKGIGIMTFTPLQGVTGIVRKFWDGGEGIYMKNATWDDAPHLDEDEKRILLAGLPEHMQKTKSTGQPMMGTGAIFGVINDSDIREKARDLPAHWRMVAGMDFGIGHECAVVWLAHDPDADAIHVIDVYHASDDNGIVHAHASRKWGDWIPVAWPHDGKNREKSSGIQLAQTFVEYGANMLGDSARYPAGVIAENEKGGPQPTEPVIQDLIARAKTGRFFVADHLDAWFEQKRFYHRKDGKIVREKDDILSATFYGMMMLRYATTHLESSFLPEEQDRNFDPIGF